MPEVNRARVSLYRSGDDGIFTPGDYYNDIKFVNILIDENILPTDQYVILDDHRRVEIFPIVPEESNIEADIIIK